MSDAPAKPISDSKGKDKETLISIVKEMTESMTGAQSTRHWAEDALWFDIPPFASRGIQPALKFFDRVFGSFQSCKIDILEMDVVVNGNMGLVCTIQRVSVVLKTGDAKRLLVRETGLLREAKRRVEIDSSTRLRPIWRRLGRQSHHGLARGQYFKVAHYRHWLTVENRHNAQNPKIGKGDRFTVQGFPRSRRWKEKYQEK